MAYASLLVTSEYLHTFLDRSELLRNVSIGGGISDSVRSAAHLEHMRAGKAVVHCKFCHALWTLCEDYYLTNGEVPYSAHQFSLLDKRYPAFVQEFREATKGFDWKAERERIKAKRSKGEAESEEDEEDEEEDEGEE